ncbi:MAG: site-2 protease family protein [Armatimonadetes bacterium]|nr:MAG: site-2 protease family protein [Armatimonadota bacterium]
MTGSGFSIGRLFNIKINADWSWLIIFGLVTWNLGALVFPQLHPEWSVFLSWTVGLAASILFFASVLAHELAHSLVAKANGLPVNEITLFVFGGVSNLQKEPTSAKIEFYMAIIGPLTSIALGVIFLLLGGFVSGNFENFFTNPALILFELSPLATLLLWLGPVNILVGLFNLIPGFPLDGGRVLRAAIWALTGNLKRSTRIAAGFGQGIAWLFIITGGLMIFGVQVPVLGAGLLSGIWLIFIGLFLNSIAQQSYQQVALKDILEKVPVAKIMRTQPETVSPDIPVTEFVNNYLMGTEERAFPVIEKNTNQLEGLVCLEDVRNVSQDMWDQKKVSHIMTPFNKLDYISPSEDVSEALDKIATKDIGQVPVVEGNKLVGILSRRDIILWLQLHGKEVV